MASSSSAWTPPGQPDIGATGTQPRGPEEYTHALLRGYGLQLAEACTRRFYAAWPELMARYGERGREHCQADQFWHLSTLDSALELGTPAILLDYVQWLRGFLFGRGMGDVYACANFVFLHEAVGALPLAPAEDAGRREVLGYLDAAIALFPEGERSPPAPQA